MNKLERVRAVLAGEEVDRPPFTFWHPFGLTHTRAETLASAAVGFAAEFQVDLLKIPGGNYYPLRPNLSLDRPGDLTRLEPLSGKDKGFLNRLSALELIAKAVREKLPFLETVPSPWTVLTDLTSHGLPARTVAEHPGFARHALEAVTQTLCSYVGAVLEAGATGIMLEVTAASHAVMSPAEYQEWSLPYDLQVLEAASPAEIRAVHLRGERLHMAEIPDYPAQLLLWPQQSAGPSLEKGKTRWPGKVMGGLDEGWLPHFSWEEIRGHVAEAGRHAPDIFSPGDELPADISLYRLEGLRQALSSRSITGARRKDEPTGSGGARERARPPAQPRRRRERAGPGR